MKSLRYRGRVFRNTSVICAARLEDRPTAFADAGTPFLQANFSSISYSVYDTSTGLPTIGNGVTYSGLPLTISAVVFDVLQNWSEDSRGANFILTIGPGAFPQGDAEYQVEVKFTLTDGRVGNAVFEVATEKTWGG